MLIWTFIVSSLLLATAVAVVYRRSSIEPRPTPLLEERLNRVTVQAVRSIREGVAATIHFARSDVLLKGLHVVTYVALICVRFLERQLERLVHILRTFRRERIPRASTHKLARAHESPNQEQGE